jgi:hypothetical protein
MGGGTIGVSTIGVGLPGSCFLASRGSSLYSEFHVGVGTRGVRLSASACHDCFVTPRVSPSPYSKFHVDVGRAGVATLAVGLPGS